MSGGPQAFRLAKGGLIDRSAPIGFRFEGRAYSGFAGDTLASALLANGVRIVGRSFKYHRPRGLLAAGAEEPNALVALGEGQHQRINLRATEVPLFEGLSARPVNCWPSSRFDVGAVNGLFARFLGAGFYYKTFMWPDWHLFEGAIRRAAGLGAVDPAPDAARHERQYGHCDLLVVGAGPAGLAAARAAARAGKRVILAEQDGLLGGSLLWDNSPIGDIAGRVWAANVAEELAALPNVRILRRTAVLGYHDHGCLSMAERLDPSGATGAMRLWLVRAARVILATGAIERPLVFAGNDRPGVMLAGAVRTYIGRFAVLPGRRAVVVTNNDEGYRAAAEIAGAGGSVAAIVDTRGDASIPASLALPDCPVWLGARRLEVRGARGVRGLLIADRDGRRHRLRCDLVAMSGGHNPTVHLFSQSGGSLRWDAAHATFVPARAAQDTLCVGAAAGESDLEAVLDAAEAAGAGAGDGAGEHAGAEPVAANPAAASTGPAWFGDERGKAFVDFQNDVTGADIALAARENFRSVEHLKRYTTLGMAPDQGKTSNVNALAIMAALTGREPADVGHTRYRFPYVPVGLGVMAGRERDALFRPFRQLECHDLHRSRGAVFEDYGEWLRPACYPRAGESAAEAERREAMQVRSRVGLFDASPLGKIEVKGPDAAAFLDLVYANRMASLEVGRVRYGLMLNEQGAVIDDGVVARLAGDHFLLGTTSAGAAMVAGWLEEWLQCEWPHLDVLVAPVTGAWGVVTLTGPRARAVLARLGPDFAVDAEAFPHMSFRIGTVADIPARVMRVSYTGEVSFEINVPTRHMPMLWSLALAAGEVDDIAPIGIDALQLLRTEKGYLHVGADTDGTTSARDVGWGHVVKKPVDFIGKRALMRPNDLAEARWQFVGFDLASGGAPLPVGAAILEEGPGRGSQGVITSSVDSPLLGKAIALGLVRAGRARTGETVMVLSDSGPRAALIVDPCFFDPDGSRLHG